MLVIQKNQWAALEQSSFNRFVNTMIAVLRRRFAEESSAATDEQLREFVESQIERAAAYDISDRQCVRAFIEIAGSYGRNFDVQLDWARAILNRRILSQRAKIDWLEEYAMFLGLRNEQL